MKNMKIAMGCDHAGFEMKQELVDFVTAAGYSVEDMGCYSSERADYPDFARKVAEAVAAGACQAGILVCGTGVGISIAANKVPGIRAANCYEPAVAALSREHNNANVLALGARFTTMEQARTIVQAWLAADFAGGRHADRVDKITRIEQKYCSDRQTGR